MRTIKFRSWDIKEKNMWYPSLIGTSTDGVLYSNPNKSDDLHFNSRYLDSIYGEKTQELMQYTGLKDKNGTEIYEGDIVIMDDKRGIVEYRATAYVIRFLEAEISETTEEEYFNDWDHITRVSSNIEVIGNIYENPDLLKI